MRSGVCLEIVDKDPSGTFVASTEAWIRPDLLFALLNRLSLAERKSDWPSLTWVDRCYIHSPTGAAGELDPAIALITCARPIEALCSDPAEVSNALAWTAEVIRTDDVVDRRELWEWFRFDGLFDAHSFVSQFEEEIGLWRSTCDAALAQQRRVTLRVDA